MPNLPFWLEIGDHYHKDEKVDVLASMEMRGFIIAIFSVIVLFSTITGCIKFAYLMSLGWKRSQS